MKWILYPLVTLILANDVFAWGPDGHKIVGQIAEDQLSATARQKVKSILKNQTLAEVSIWADTIRSKPEYRHTKSWHFVNIPDGETYATTEHDHAGDVVTAISEQVEILKDPSSSDLEKEEALKFIVHFVGDIHQPLHAGRPDDRGGNSVEVVFKGRKMNLHSLWDSGMIGQQGMDYTRYARYLQSMSLLAENYDIPEFPFSTVIREDMDARKDIYNFRAVAHEAQIVLTDSYMQRNLARMNERLLSGGKRLAVMLNMIFK